MLNVLLNATLCDRVDYPECNASFCEECDRQGQEQGKSYFGHITTYIFIMHVAKYHSMHV